MPEVYKKFLKVNKLLFWGEFRKQPWKKFSSINVFKFFSAIMTIYIYCNCFKKNTVSWAWCKCLPIRMVSPRPAWLHNKILSQKEIKESNISTIFLNWR
jgi:hypothetical protein